jgi:cobalamin biosynthesis protein CobT
MGITPDLDCLKWITPQLWVRPEEKKVLFVICDGEPTAYGAGLTLRLRHSYKQYINACKEAGIKVFGFGIEANISEYFGEDWAYVTSSSLSDTFIERLRIILNS